MTMDFEIRNADESELMRTNFWPLCSQAIVFLREGNVGAAAECVERANEALAVMVPDEESLIARGRYLFELKKHVDSGTGKRESVLVAGASIDTPPTSVELLKRIQDLEAERDRLVLQIKNGPSIDPFCLADPAIQSVEVVKEEFGIIVFGHTRLDALGAVLESLHRQGALQFTEVWLDGYQGNDQLRSKIQKTVDLVGQYPVKRLHTQAGNYGFRKMLILGLADMSRRYENILVLEDDCFPTHDAVQIFREELDVIRNDDRFFSVYGHHFLVESETDLCNRFQGWGWATTSEKLRPVLKQLIDCYSMAEDAYLDFVKLALTPEIRQRIDVTPPRQPTFVLEKFFAWDETVCLLAALNSQSHKPTRKRTVYNCGMGIDSTHFQDSEVFRKPPFNLITPAEVWDWF